MSILVFNAGSSTLKFALFDAKAQESLAAGCVDWPASAASAHIEVRQHGASPLHRKIEARDHGSAVLDILAALAETTLRADASTKLQAVGHRVVHGGTEFQRTVVVDASVKAGIARLSELAPLHNPAALATISAAETALEGIPHVVTFDTAFFATLPPKAFIYPLPYEWYSDWGIRRFGFHGISHNYCAERAAHLLGSEKLRLIVCHLGNGCSATAVKNGRALATTMGFTPMEGLMMGTRAGSVDSAILLHLQQHRQFSAKELSRVLNHGSGLLGVSGVAADFRTVQAAAESGHERARLALEMFVDRARSAIGALATTLGGVDALVFTAGIGERNAFVRASICEGLEHLGLRLERDRNSLATPDSDVALDDSPARILVIETREDLMIARQVRDLVSTGRH